MVIKKAYGCYIEDMQGNKFIDTSMGAGSQIIGHDNELIRKISEQIKRGTIYTIPNIHTDAVNFYLKKYINPEFHDEYVFCNTGTEANMRAIRLARAYTEKNKIGRFHGGWHGGLDGFIESSGVPSIVNKLVEVLPYNDERCFEKITPDLAAIIIEPVQGSNPRSDIETFLHKLRERCTETGVLLIFDEVMTGFRLSMRGGAGVFGVTPDLVTYGKVLGGGFPIGAVGGKKEIMKTKNVFYGGTFSANPLTMYAAKLILKTIINKIYIRYDKLNLMGELLRDKLNQIFIDKKKPMRVIGCGSTNRIVFTDKIIKNREDRDKLESQNQNFFYNQLKSNGVFINDNGIIQLSMSHTHKIINKISSAVATTI